MKFLDRIIPFKISDFPEGSFYSVNLHNIQIDEVEEARSLLDAKTIQRSHKFILIEDQHHCIIVQASLKHCLSKFINSPPQKIILTKKSSGKPYVKNNPIHFNISHTRECAVLGFHPSLEIGLDIEKFRKLPDYFDVSKQFMHPEEIIKMKDAESPLHYFFSIWCIKEAFLKATEIDFDKLRDYCLVRTHVNIENDSKFTYEQTMICLYHKKIKSHKLAICIYDQK
ncbi:MAG: hypothetical protein S4CHLAM7_07790 [Chlamydiae bacterium]|nr:hypothetical protein [Chlamydiota bacterium]